MLTLDSKSIQYGFLIFFFSVEMVPSFRTSSLWWWMWIAVLCFLFVMDSWKNRSGVTIELKPFEKWYFPFVAYAVMSIVWASNKNNTWDYIPTIMLTCIICVILSQIIRTEKDLEAVLFARYFASVVLCVYIFLNIDLSILGNERIGVDILGDGWNANSIALKLTIGCILGIEQLKHISKFMWKLVVITTVVGMFTIMLFCGSRTALIIGVCGIAAYMWLGGKRNKVAITCLIVVGIYVLYQAIMTIPELYNVLGSRLSNLEEGLKGHAKSGSGTAVRLTMLKNGVFVFLDHPILGVGMNNFRNVFGGMFGIYKYSHSNHMEVLTNFGIIGASLFFSSFIYLLRKGLKGILTQGTLDKYQIFAVCSVLVLFISGFGSVYYMQTNEMILLTLCYSGIYLSENVRTTK